MAIGSAGVEGTIHPEGLTALGQLIAGTIISQDKPRKCRKMPDGLSAAKPIGSLRSQDSAEESSMCRNIRTLFNFEPPATDDEIRASALQFVRKLSGFTNPSRANEAAFGRAVGEVTEAAHRLLAALETASPARNREVEAMKARERARERFA
jgi:hypothetical protein